MGICAAKCIALFCFNNVQRFPFFSLGRLSNGEHFRAENDACLKGQVLCSGDKKLLCSCLVVPLQYLRSRAARVCAAEVGWATLLALTAGAAGVGDLQAFYSKFCLRVC